MTSGTTALGGGAVGAVIRDGPASLELVENFIRLCCSSGPGGPWVRDEEEPTFWVKTEGIAAASAETAMTGRLACLTGIKRR